MTWANRMRVGNRTRSMLVSRSAVLRLFAIVVGTALATAALLLGPGTGTAVAHDVLVGSTPASDTTVPTSPSSVTLEFSQSPQPLGAEVLVTAPDGTPSSDGAVQLCERSVVQPLVDDLPAGR